MATRHAPASRVLADLLKQIEKGLKPGLYVLTGDDSYHLDAAQRHLLDHLVPSGTSEFALTVYSNEKVQASAVVAAARSAGMFSSRRVVLVRDLSALAMDSQPDALVAYAKSPPHDSFLIVRAVGLDQRFKLHKALGTAGRLLRFEMPRFADLRSTVSVVKKMAAARKLKLDPRAADFLAEVTGGDLYRLTSELDKLRAWMASEETREVTFEAVRQVAAGSDVMSGWEIADAIMSRDRSAGLAAVARLIESGDEPLKIVGGVAYRARTMLQAKAMLERGTAPRQVLKDARVWRDGDELLRGLSRYTFEELLAFPSILLEADRSLKGSSLPPRRVLEHLVGRMTSPSSPG